MSWRTVVISSKCKLSYKNNYLVVRSDEVNMIHLSEINTLVIDTTMVSVTSLLMCELLNKKIKVIFCDERHNPKGEIVGYYGSHNTSKKVLNQTKWEEKTKGRVWQNIIKQKINNQSKILRKYNKENYNKLNDYIEEVEVFDLSNREGHSAKVYFNSLFGMNFTRDDASDINAALDYGYAILLSTINKEVVSCGYITQLGINHKNEFNQFNLTCDLMEPFRPIVDDIVYQNRNFDFNKDFKYKLVNILNEKVKVNQCEYFVSNAISMYVNSVLKALDTENFEDIIKVEVI